MTGRRRFSRGPGAGAPPFDRGWLSHRRLWWVALVALLLLGSAPVSGLASAGPLRAPMQGSLPAALAPPPTNNVSYASSMDAFPLSYLEWIPGGFAPSASYPLAVFLHGIGTESQWIPGGIGGINDITSALVDNASQYGFLLIAINTRSSDGFYIDSPCGGPQQQDVLDAIAHESALRHVSSVYLIGFSMGSLGSFSIAGHHKGLFSGVATAGTISDIYETVAYSQVTRSAPSGLSYAECGTGVAPANSSVARVWTSLSVLRFDPQNFSGIPLFVAGGGDDLRAPNNFARWEFANVNNTFVNSTCIVAAGLMEPANCTMTIPTLAAADPSAFRWIDLYEPYAPHSAAQLPAGAVFSFFLGRTASGYYVSVFPGGALIPYTPGTPNPIPPPTEGPSFPDWTWFALAGIAAVAVVAAAVALSRRSPPR